MELGKAGTASNMRLMLACGLHKHTDLLRKTDVLIVLLSLDLEKVAKDMVSPVSTTNFRCKLRRLSTRATMGMN